MTIGAGNRCRHVDRPWTGVAEWISPITDYRPDGFTPPTVALVRRADGSLYASLAEDLVLAGVDELRLAPAARIARVA